MCVYLPGTKEESSPANVVSTASSNFSLSKVCSAAAAAVSFVQKHHQLKRNRWCTWMMINHYSLEKWVKLCFIGWFLLFITFRTITEVRAKREPIETFLNILSETCWMIHFLDLLRRHFEWDIFWDIFWVRHFIETFWMRHFVEWNILLRHFLSSQLKFKCKAWPFPPKLFLHSMY